jgi:Na+-transporting methylmalonyl-CoA/oxaloacetate decarboxylase gamma subunit
MEHLNLGLNLTLVGLGTVFLVLVLLQLTMNIQSLALNNLMGSKGQNPNSASVAVNMSQSGNASLEVSGFTKSAQPETVEKTISPQLLAAIVGAIACQTGQPAQKFRVVSVRHAEDKSASNNWSLMGRTDLINTRSSFYAQGGSK